MKRTTISLAICLLSYSFMFAQLGVEEQCVNCKGNEISNMSSTLGVENVASGENSFASGKLNSATGDFSTTLGFYNSAEGKFSLAGGEHCIASGMRSFAFGRYATSESSISLALGSFIRAYGTNSIAIGCNVETTNSNAVVIGRGIQNENRIINNISNSLMIGFNSNRHTLFVDKASGLNTTGEIGIGNVTDPAAKLHILGDDDYLRPYDASLYIQSSGNYYSTLWLGDKDHYIKTKPNQDLQFNAADKDFIFENGNVGIGNDNPVTKLQVSEGDIYIDDINHGIIMKSPDGSCWRGTIDNSGSLQFVQVNCNDLSVGTEEQSLKHESLVNIYPNPASDRVFVSINQEITGAQLEISDMNGKLMYSEKLSNTESYVDLSGYRPGMYLFKLMDVDGRVIDSKKIIKD